MRRTCDHVLRAAAGIREAMAHGILAGHEMTGVQVTLNDGSFHDVDSSEMAFKIAGSMAFKTAAKKAKPVKADKKPVVVAETEDRHVAEKPDAIWCHVDAQ